MGIRERNTLLATAVILAGLVLLRIGTVPRQARPDLRIAAGISLPAPRPHQTFWTV